MPGGKNASPRPDREGCYLNSRHFNPTVDVLDRPPAAMEGTKFAVGTSSGMSSITCALLHVCRAGDQFHNANNRKWGAVYSNFRR